MKIVGEHSLVRCDNCQNRFICIIKQKYEECLLESRTILEDDYPDLCSDVLIVVARHCKLFKVDDEDFYGES